MSIYKECDIRGIYNNNLDEKTAYLIGRAAGSELSGKSLVLGSDIRESTPELKKNLIKGLLESGADIVDLGTVPTPLMYFGKKFLKTDGGIMITASHNPPEYNGFKIILRDMPVTPEDIKNLEKRIINNNFTDGKGSIKTYSIEQDYIDFVLPRIIPEKKLNVVIDACNGSMSYIAPKLFRLAGHNVSELFCSYDGKFPNRNPNPAVYSNLKKIQEAVIKEQADIGVAFDGDGDRVVFIDNKGNYCESERSFVLFINEYLSGEKGSVVYDGKSSSVVKDSIEKTGSTAIMERSGHAFIKRTFIENNSVLAGEISGHFFFRELGFDDGLYAALKMAQILSRGTETLAEKISRIQKTVITPDLRIPMNDENIRRLIDSLGKLEKEYKIIRLDGIRVEFPGGWVLVRKSVTEPVVTVRLEAGSKEEALKISSMVFESSYPEIHNTVIKSI